MDIPITVHGNKAIIEPPQYKAKISETNVEIPQMMPIQPPQVMEGLPVESSETPYMYPQF